MDNCSAVQIIKALEFPFIMGLLAIAVWFRR